VNCIEELGPSMLAIVVSVFFPLVFVSVLGLPLPETERRISSLTFPSSTPSFGQG